MKNFEELRNENLAWAKETFEKIDKKLSAVTLRSRDKLPDGVDENGFHKNFAGPKSSRGWTLGFWGGLNYLMYDYTKKEDYLTTARRSRTLLENVFAPETTRFDYICHDVGFMWHLVEGAEYRISGDESAKSYNEFMAATLASRFVLCKDGNGFIQAWNDGTWDGKQVRDWSIIDCMMNLPQLYFASEVTGNDRFTRIAMAHADNALACHVRSDGSVNHIVEHDRTTGELVKTYGGQGIAEGSSWSRGCAWGLYGYVLSYLHTKEQRYLDAAKRIAGYFISCCCDDWLPRIDFRAPSEPVYYDSTAAACAACGMLELAKVLPKDEGGVYAHGAIEMLRALDRTFADYDPKNDAMIGGGSVRYPLKPEWMSMVHISIIYADFFYTEAILKLLGSDFLIW